MIRPLNSATKCCLTPQRLNNPFYYQPHPLCIAAAEEVKDDIHAMKEWAYEIEQGKMFGVLVVEDLNHNIGYIKAYSGQIGGREDWADWVPAIYDYLQPNGYFKQHEKEISEINSQIDLLSASDIYRINCHRLLHAEKGAQQQIEIFREKMAQCKQIRQQRREAGEDNATLIRESQFMKAEMRRLKKRLEKELAPLRDIVRKHEEETNRLRAKRKQLSDALQIWLFTQFRIINGLGEERNLLEIFANTPTGVPPSGAGECCAPKLLQYAFTHSLRPIAIAEFWWGQSPIGEIRKHHYYYPACEGKCRPILDFMLKGIDIEPNPLQSPEHIKSVNVIYEDDTLIIINKPSGMLSVPGKGERLSAQEILTLQHGGNTKLYCVHRLDMQTSGLLMFAKSESTQKIMQKAFSNQKVRKFYRAILSGIFSGPLKGEINLTLSADYINRPRQKVDYEDGKSSLTLYEVLETNKERTTLRLQPLTGRTHQLRVHCAHQDGLGIPIVGDDLYGCHDERLLLHAEELIFDHPVTGKVIHTICKAPF